MKLALNASLVIGTLIFFAFPSTASAAVTYINPSAKAAGTGATTPALPTGIAADDIIILVATTIAGGTMSITDNGSVASWTAITGTPVDVTGGEKLWVWWGRYSSGSTGPTVTPGGDHSVSATFAFRGAFSNADPIDVSNVGSEATSDTSFSFATAISSTVNDVMAVVVYTSGVDSNTGQGGTTANTSLSSLALRAEYQTNAGGGGGFVLSTGLKAIAGTLGTWTDTMVSATPKAYATFALKPVTVPTLTTQSASGVGGTSATLNGTITDTGGANATARGFAWGTDAALSGGDTATTTESGSFGTGAFTESSLTLVCNTTYYSRAYATNSAGTGVGSISASFTTSACAPPPTVTTNFANPGATTATLYGTKTGGEDATQHGFVWGTNANLSGGDTATTTLGALTSNSSFSSGISGLSTGATYYFRAYATGSTGTGYGIIRNFVTGNTTASRNMRLFEGFTIKLRDGRIILNQQ